MTLNDQPHRKELDAHQTELDHHFLYIQGHYVNLKDTDRRLWMQIERLDKLIAEQSK